MRTPDQMKIYDDLKNRKLLLRDIIPSTTPNEEIAPDLKHIIDKREKDKLKRKSRPKQSIYWDGEIHLGSSKISQPLWKQFNLYEKLTIARKAFDLFSVMDQSNSNFRIFESALNTYEDALIKLYRKYHVNRNTIRNKSYISLYVVAFIYKTMSQIKVKNASILNKWMIAGSLTYMDLFPGSV